MSRYVLTDEAKQDIIDIRRYLRNEAGASVALSVIRKITAAFSFLGKTPGAGHRREDLTPEPVKFWPVFSSLIVYDPMPRPIQIIRILHGRREIDSILRNEDDQSQQDD